jgi:hypothetical protein
MSVPLMKQPSAFVPLAMSLVGLTMVIVYATMFGVVHGGPERAPARIFQLLMVAQIPIGLFFAIKWLPREPKQTLLVLALQAGAWLAAVGTIFLIEKYG